MHPTKFAEAMARLTHHDVGLQEAAVLFLVATGIDTNKGLAAALGSPMSHIHSRTNILKRKKILKKGLTANGNMRHELTARGGRIVRDTLDTEL